MKISKLHQVNYEHKKIRKYDTPSHRLMKAVLIQAIDDLHTKEDGRLKFHSKMWFNSNNKEDLFSFESICLHIHKSPNVIRRHLGLLYK